MNAETDTVRGRATTLAAISSGRATVLALALVAALGFTLLFVQEPMVHDALHNFRHSAGVTCH
jgi:cobalt transporter subunit CbtB